MRRFRMAFHRNAWITLFVILFTGAFHYETLRLNYFSPWVGRPLPKVKFLFPPAGWIMFFRVDASYGFAQVYGFQGNQATWIDPHEIFETRFIGYDNTNRNVLISVLSPTDAPWFCRYLRRKFPEYDGFLVMHSFYPDLIHRPGEKLSQVAYRCD